MSTSSKMFSDMGSSSDDVMPSFNTMQLPTPLLKYGQQGNPHFRYFFLSKSKTSLIWHSDKKKSVPTKIDITTMTRLENGQRSDIFRRNKASKSHPEHLSFSLYYKRGSSERTLDVVCKDQMECDIWVRGLLYLIKNKDTIVAEAGDLSQDIDHFDGGVKIVNVKNLHQQMHAHLDLCTWGSSQWGQLGHSDDSNDIKDEASPKKVRYLVDHDVDLKFVECGDSHTVTVSKSGECYAWGNSNSGRLGVIAGGTSTAQEVEEGASMRHILVPQVVVGLNGIPIQTVACGSAHTLFVTEDQRLYATGCNISGQLGTGDRRDQLTPVSVPLPAGVKVLSASAGEQFSAIVATASDSQNHLYTWGGNIYGNLGHGDVEPRLTPTRVDALAVSHTVTSVSCGAFHVAVIATEVPGGGGVSTTGVHVNMSGGDDEDEDEDEIKLEREDSEILYKDSEMFNVESFGLRTVLMTWGWGLCGQLGHGDFTDVTTPKVVDFFQTKNTPIKVSCGTGQTACILESASEGRLLYIWGAGPCVSKTGDSNTPDLNTPLCIDTMSLLSTHASKSSEFDIYTLVQDIACGDMHTLILTGEGLLHIYGKLSQFMGNVSRLEDYSENDAKSIACGGNHMAVLLGRKWIKDEDADKCMKCSKEFTFVFRQHHCRSCGGIYCGDCTKKRAPVLKFGYQEMVRVCDTCYTRINNGAMK